MKKTEERKLPWSVLTMYGVMTAMMVFHSQFEAVDRATPRERMGSGKTSPMTICSMLALARHENPHQLVVLTHAPGPHVEAKKKMKMAMNAIWALTAEMLLAIDLPAALV